MYKLVIITAIQFGMLEHFFSQPIHKTLYLNVTIEEKT
jgi:hypothetical protein